MCQINPFTLPCCRRVYVEISRLPSCPDAWPKLKCPSELCIQVRAFEPEDKPTGTCWRCKAAAAGKIGHERNKMRPGVDSAEIVVGLEEPTVQQRRQMAEDDGKCWFCSAQGGCTTCGSKRIPEDVIPDEAAAPTASITPLPKRARHESEAKRGRRKKVKVEANEHTPQTPTPLPASSESSPTSYPQQNIDPAFWQPTGLTHVSPPYNATFSPLSSFTGSPYFGMYDFSSQSVNTAGAYPELPITVPGNWQNTFTTINDGLNNSYQATPSAQTTPAIKPEDFQEPEYKLNPNELLGTQVSPRTHPTSVCQNLTLLFYG
jgi:hypothetical protein